jgi:purine-binding chemotaxis protein CheW
MAEAQLVVFRLGKEQFAAPIERVREILRPVKFTRMPRAGTFVQGLFNLRGQVLPLLDLKARLGLQKAAAPAMPEARDNKARVVVVEATGEAFGVQVDEVLEVLRCDRDNLQSPQSVLELQAGRSLASVLDQEGRLVLVLDVERLLDGAGEAMEGGRP